VLTSSELKDIIEEAITAIWVNEIQDDYRNMWLLKEDTLKNAMYFHLRNRLGKLMDENSVRIYTEFTDGDYKHSGYRPDMVIAKVDASKEVDYWGDSVTECLAVIELKYKSGFSASEEIYADYIVDGEEGVERFLLRTVEMNDESSAAVAFTSHSEMRKAPKSAMLSFFIDSALEAVYKNDKLSGLVINPCGDAFFLTKSMIGLIFEQKARESREEDSSAIC